MEIVLTRNDTNPQMPREVISESTSLYIRYIQLSVINSKVYNVHFPMGTIKMFPNVSIMAEFNRQTGFIDNCVPLEHPDEDGLLVVENGNSPCKFYDIKIQLSGCEINDLRNAIGK